MLMSQRTDPQEEGKCVQEGAICVSLSVTLCVREQKREGKREVVLAALPLFVITSVNWCWPFLSLCQVPSLQLLS